MVRRPLKPAAKKARTLGRKRPQEAPPGHPPDGAFALRIRTRSARSGGSLFQVLVLGLERLIALLQLDVFLV